MSEPDVSASAEGHWYGCEDVPGHSVQCLIQRVNDAPNSSSEQALVAHIAALEAELQTARSDAWSLKAEALDRQAQMQALAQQLVDALAINRGRRPQHGVWYESAVSALKAAKALGIEPTAERTEVPDLLEELRKSLEPDGGAK